MGTGENKGSHVGRVSSKTGGNIINDWSTQHDEEPLVSSEAKKAYQETEWFVGCQQLGWFSCLFRSLTLLIFHQMIPLKLFLVHDIGSAFMVTQRTENEVTNPPMPKNVR